MLAGTDYKWKQALWIGGTIALVSVLLVKLVGCRFVFIFSTSVCQDVCWLDMLQHAIEGSANKVPKLSTTIAARPRTRAVIFFIAISSRHIIYPLALSGAVFLPPALRRGFPALLLRRLHLQHVRHHFFERKRDMRDRTPSPPGMLLGVFLGK